MLVGGDGDQEDKKYDDVARSNLGEFGLCAKSQNLRSSLTRLQHIHAIKQARESIQFAGQNGVRSVSPRFIPKGPQRPVAASGKQF